jgi:imidazolonepropionase-like amidohydrolase
VTRQERRLVPGPRVYPTINLISKTGGHRDGWYPSGIVAPLLVPHPGRPSGVADGIDGVRKTVREMIRAGAYVIKIATSGGSWRRAMTRGHPARGRLRPLGS